MSSQGVSFWVMTNKKPAFRSCEQSLHFNERGHKCPALATRSLLSFFIRSSTLLWGVEVWNNPTFLSHPKFLTSQRCRGVEKSDEVTIMSPFFPSHDPSVILYLVLHFSEVWKYEIVWQSQDIVAFSPQSRIPWHSFVRACQMVRKTQIICSLAVLKSKGPSNAQNDHS